MRKTPGTTLSVVLAVIGLINVIVCPGNATRKASEITRWFPQYEHFSLPDKVLIQISHLGVYITSTYGSLHVVFGLCILAGAIMGRKLTPMILTSLSTAITGFNAPVLQSRLQEVAALISAKKLTQDDLTRLYWPMALFVTCLLMLIVAIVLTYGTSMVSLTILGSTGLSAILFLTVSESPTLLASVDRPLVPFYIAVIASCSLMINQMANYFMAKGKDVPEEFTQESGSPHTKTRCGN